MTNYALSYFDFHGGRGEDCRLALHLGGASWTDDRVKGADWATRKASTPFGAMPVLKVEGRGTIAQSNAILGYLGRTFDLHPTDPYEAAQHEMLMNAAEDLRVAVGATLFLKDEDAKKAAREALAKDTIPTWGARIEACLGAGPFVAGDKLNVVDLKLFVLHKWFASGSLDHIPADVLAGAPKLTRLCAAVSEHPGVAGYYAGKLKA